MAATTLRELLVLIGVDGEDAEKNLAAVDSAIDGVKENMGALVTAAAAVTAALAATAGAFIAQAVATGEYAEQVLEQAAALGVTTDEYQALVFIASKYGIESEKITLILSKLAADQAAVADGNADIAATYAALGLSMEDVASASPAELLAELADGFSAVSSDSERLALASAIFGDRMAGSIIPLLQQGSDGLADMARQAEDLGVIMDGPALQSANEFNDQVETLGLLLTGVRNEIGLAVIPALTGLAKRFLAWYEANQDIIKQKIDEYAGKVGDAFTAAGEAVARVDALVGGADGWAKLLAIMASLGGATGAGWVALKVAALVASLVQAGVAVAGLVGGGTTLGVILLAIAGGVTQIAAVLAYAAGFFLLWQDWVTYLQGGDSVIGRLIEKWRTSQGLLGSLARLVEAYGAVGRVVFGEMTNAFSRAVNYARPLLQVVEAIASVIGGALVAALNKAAPLIDMVSKALTELAGYIGGGTVQADVSGAASGAASMQAGASTQAGIATQAAAGAATLSSLGQSAYAATPASVSVGGDTITISGLGLSEPEVRSVLDAYSAEKARRVASAIAGAEV